MEVDENNRGIGTEIKELKTLMLDIAMSMTEASIKIYEPELYDEVVNNSIHGRRWRKAIKKELHNLENHQT